MMAAPAGFGQRIKLLPIGRVGFGRIGLRTPNRTFRREDLFAQGSLKRSGFSSHRGPWIFFRRVCMTPRRPNFLVLSFEMILIRTVVKVI